MTSLPGPDAPRVLLTIEQVAEWKAALLRVDEEMARLSAEREEYVRKLTAASVFLDIDGVVPAEAVASPRPADVPAPKAHINPPRRRRRRSAGTTWADVVLAAVNSAEMGLTYAEMRRFASDSELGPKLIQSDKGYHNAISRLAKGGDIVREHGRLFTKKAYERFLAAVEAGDASTIVPQPMAHSPMGEAILSIVVGNPGRMNGKAVIQELRKDTEFNATLTPHETGAYNIIARLVRRGQLTRRDDGMLLPGPNFPRDRGNGPYEAEAPNGQAAGASEAGEAGTSPNDAQSTLRLIG